MKIKLVRVALAVSVLGSGPFALAGSQSGIAASKPGFFRSMVQKVKASFGIQPKAAALVEGSAAAPLAKTEAKAEPAPVVAKAAEPAPVAAPAAVAVKAAEPVPVAIAIAVAAKAAAPVAVAASVAAKATEPARVTLSISPNPASKPTTPSLSKPIITARPVSSSYRWEEPVRAKAAYTKLSFAERAPIDKLLSQIERPTVDQLMKAVRAAYGGTIPSENPFGSAGHVKHEAALISDMVAQLEHAFPGGQWLPLGRDAVLIADALDGFYRSIGQADRVRRLDMSGLSLPHYRDANSKTYEEDRPMIYGFLKANGLDLGKVKDRPPYVMIDVTSYGETSQSTQLMRSTYRTWVKDFGGKPADLYEHVNFIGTPMGGRSTFISDHRDIDSVKAKLRAGTGTDGPEELLYLGGNMHKLTYTAAWHADFLKMYKKADGTVTADPGRASSTESREAVLAELFEVHALTTSPAFLAQVQKTAKDKYGYAFPMQRTEQLVRTGKAPVAAATATPATSKASTVDVLELVGAPKESLRIDKSASRSTGKSADGYMAALKLRLPAAPNKTEVAVEFLRDLAGMRARNSVDTQAARAAIREINTHVKLKSPQLAAELIETYALFPSFRAEVQKALKKKN